MKKILILLLSIITYTGYSQGETVLRKYGNISFSLGSSITITDVTPISLNPTVPTQCDSFLWTTDGTGEFADSSLKNTTYTPSSGDLLTDTITLSLKTWCDWGDSAILYSHKIVVIGNYYEFETIELLASLTTPISDTATLKLNNLIVMLKDSVGVDTLSEFFDRFFLLANETAEASVFDLCDSLTARRCTAVNAPTFTAFQGFTFNGTTNYLNSNFNAYTQGVNFTLNNCGIGCYSRTNVSQGLKSLLGIKNLTSFYTSMIPMYNSYTYFTLNSAASGIIKEFNTTTNAFFSLTRNGSLYTNIIGYKNYTPLTTVELTGSTTAIPSDNIYIGARNSMGVSADTFWDGEISVVFFSKYLTASLNTKILRCIEYYMDSNGKGIVP